MQVRMKEMQQVGGFLEYTGRAAKRYREGSP